MEVKHKGIWGTVCDDNFTGKEAKVICKMLGFGVDKAAIHNGSDVATGSGPIWIRLEDNEGCQTGLESHFEECKPSK